MREVANFMRMYPSYKLVDVLNEYAISFFALLEQGYRLKFAEYRMQANITLIPSMEDAARKSFMRELEWASIDPDAILDNESTENGISKLKEMLEGK